MREKAWTNRAVTVTNGEGTELVIDRDAKLWVTSNDSKVNILLGPATKERIDQLIFNLQQARPACS